MTYTIDDFRYTSGPDDSGAAGGAVATVPAGGALDRINRRDRIILCQIRWIFRAAFFQPISTYFRKKYENRSKEALDYDHQVRQFTMLARVPPVVRDRGKSRQVEIQNGGFAISKKANEFQKIKPNQTGSDRGVFDTGFTIYESCFAGGCWPVGA